MMRELYFADAPGVANLIAARVHRTVLTLAFEKQSEPNAMCGLSLPTPFQQPLLAGAGGFFAPHVRAYMRHSGAPDTIGALVACNFHKHDITLERWWRHPCWGPIRYSGTCCPHGPARIAPPTSTGSPASPTRAGRGLLTARPGTSAAAPPRRSPSRALSAVATGR